MSKTSQNLSDRIFFTVNFNNGTAYIGELTGNQKTLVEFSKKELAQLASFIDELNVFGDLDEEEE